MRKLTACMIFLVCFSAQAKQGYQGIGADLPSGSKWISPQGLVAAYDFETYTENGQLRDFSPLGNHGALAKKQSAKGVFGDALVLTDKEDVVILPNNPELNLTGPLTVAARLKISTAGLHQHLLACNDLFVLWLTTSNKYRFADTLGQGFTTANGIEVVESGQWHSVVAVLSVGKGDTLNDGNIRIFVDGEQIEGKHEKTWAPTEMAAQKACVIGGTRNGGQKHQDLQFEGVIDELQVYSRAFTDEEISAYSHQGS